MISPYELRRKVQRIWDSGKFLKSWLKGIDPFPMEIRFGSPSGRRLSHDFNDVRDWIAGLQRDSKGDGGGRGYMIEYRTVEDRRLGRQEIPCMISFEGVDDWLSYIGREKDFADFKALAEQTERRIPGLTSFLEESPLKALDNRSDWSTLLTVCEWFIAHPSPDLYLRQLDIKGVDTKFIETRKGILTELLRICLVQEADPDITVRRNSLERRFGLRYDQPVIRLRILDRRYYIAGLSDLGLPLSDLAAWDLGVKTVFITENKINGLAFPDVEDALIIFGLGYGVEAVSEIGWLRDKAVWYWGDIDTHGFAILSQTRGYLPRTRSLLMDHETFFLHSAMWGEEGETRRDRRLVSKAVAETLALAYPEGRLFVSWQEWKSRSRMENNIFIKELETKDNSIAQSAADPVNNITDQDAGYGGDS
jgi:hypothetical protein